MSPTLPQSDLRPAALTREDLAALPATAPAELKYRVIDAADAWFAVAYQILAEQFDASVLDSQASYADLFRPGRQNARCPLLMVVAYLPRGDRAALVGVISGNLMALTSFAGPNPASDRPPFIFAIGHQVTGKLVREAGLRGVGSQLFHAAVEEARARVARLGGALPYCFCEAENDSLGFWTKAGFRWPRGVRYWQPPLEFDAEGRFVHAEVPEVLMLRPMEGVPAAAIDRVLLQNVIATVYLDWSLAKCRATLSGPALGRVEEYVMGHLFGRVCARMPAADPVPLVHLVLPEGRPAHRRTIALPEGIQHHLEPLPLVRRNEVEANRGKRKPRKEAAGEKAALDVLEAMSAADGCRNVLAFSGPLTLARLAPAVAALIESGFVHAIIADAAAVDLAFCAERGHKFFRVPQGKSDTWLHEHGYNRIGDVLATQYALDELEDLAQAQLAGQPWDRALGSAELIQLLATPVQLGVNRGALAAAASKGVPVFVPEFTSGALGLAFGLFNHHRREARLPELRFDPFLDLRRYHDLLGASPARGLMVVGDGAARAWAGQVSAYVDGLERRTNALAARPLAFTFAVRVALSAADSLTAAISTGQLTAPEEGGLLAEMSGDPDVLFPRLVHALLERRAPTAV